MFVDLLTLTTANVDIYNKSLIFTIIYVIKLIKMNYKIIKVSYFIQKESFYSERIFGCNLF